MLFNTDGYPRMSGWEDGVYNPNIKGHRKSYEVFKGEIPEGSVVRHTCDNISCVNPSHLILGSASQNMSDRRDRGRTHLHVSDETNKHILELRSKGYSQTQVSKMVDCSQTHISKLELGKYKYSK